MSFARRPLLLTLVLIASTCAIGDALAAEWPEKRRFVLVEPPSEVEIFPPPSSIAEDSDGSLLLVLPWPGTVGSTQEPNLTRLVRIGPDGSRAFLAPFGELDPAGPFRRPGSTRRRSCPCPTGRSSSRGGTRSTVDSPTDRSSASPEPPATAKPRPATAARRRRPTSAPLGLTQFPDGSIVFGDGDGRRVRRVAPDGILTTIAGSTGGRSAAIAAMAARQPRRSSAGPATSCRQRTAAISSPNLPGPCPPVITRLRRRHHNRLTASRRAAGLDHPQHLARLPDGTLLIGEYQRIRQVAPDGTISTLLELPETHGNREGDFAGRHSDTIEAMEVTREGGIAVILGERHLRATYLAPPSTRRTLVALRDTRASQRRIKVTLDATRAGRADCRSSAATESSHTRRGTSPQAGRPSPSTALRRRIPRRPRDIARRPPRPSSRHRPPVHQRDTPRATRDPDARQRSEPASASPPGESTARPTSKKTKKTAATAWSPTPTGSSRAASSSGAPTADPATADRSRSTPPPPRQAPGARGPGDEPASPVAHLGRRQSPNQPPGLRHRQSGPSARWSGRTPRSDWPSHFSSGRPRG